MVVPGENAIGTAREHSAQRSRSAGCIEIERVAELAMVNGTGGSNILLLSAVRADRGVRRQLCLLRRLQRNVVHAAGDRIVDVWDRGTRPLHDFDALQQER